MPPVSAGIVIVIVVVVIVVFVAVPSAKQRHHALQDWGGVL